MAHAEQHAVVFTVPRWLCVNGKAERLQRATLGLRQHVRLERGGPPIDGPVLEVAQLQLLPCPLCILAQVNRLTLGRGRGCERRQRVRPAGGSIQPLLRHTGNVHGRAGVLQPGHPGNGRQRWGGVLVCRVPHNEQG